MDATNDRHTSVGVPRASCIYQPGINVFAPGVERYLVSGCGSTMLRVEKGDHLTLADLEGQQGCELLFVDVNGRFDVSALGSKATGKAY